MIDKNDLINYYSSSMGNSENKFIDFAISKGITDYKNQIKEFTLIQNQVYDHIFKFTEPNLKLTSQEIESLSREFCKSHFKWLDSKGIKALNRWLIWMCWHEGILKENE